MKSSSQENANISGGREMETLVNTFKRIRLHASSGAVVSIKTQKRKFALDELAESNQLAVDILSKLRDNYPIIKGVVVAFKLIVDLNRRGNDGKVQALKVEIESMMTVFLQLQGLPNPSTVKAKAGLRDVLEEIEDEIMVASAFCDYYMKKSLLKKCLKSRIYEARFAFYAQKFYALGVRLHRLLSLHVKWGIYDLQKSSEEFHTQIADFKAQAGNLFMFLQTAQEKALVAFIESNGGAKACLQNKESLDEFVRRSGDAVGNFERGGEQQLKKILLEEVSEDLDEALRRNLLIFQGKLDVQPREINRIDGFHRPIPEQRETNITTSIANSSYDDYFDLSPTQCLQNTVLGNQNRDVLEMDSDLKDSENIGEKEEQPNRFGNFVLVSRPDPVVQLHAGLTTQSVTADLALQHIHENRDTFHTTLANGGYRGAYSFHSGFDLATATAHLQNLEEEIYIILDSEPSEELRNVLEEVARPFSLIVMATSAKNEVEKGIQESSEAGGEQSGTNRDRDNGNGSEDRGNSGREFHEQGGNKSGEEDGMGDNIGKPAGDDGHGDDEDKRQQKEDEDGNDDDSNQEAQDNKGRSSHRSGSIVIPFSSYLTSPKHDQNFEISCHVMIEVHEKGANTEFWPGPSLVVDIKRFHVTSESLANYYTLSLCQVQIVASSSPTNVVHYSPVVVHPEGSNKSRKERTVAGTASMTVSMNPSIRFDGKFGSSKGLEQSQQPWGISSHRPGLVETATNDRNGKLWKYVRNIKGGFRPVVTENFEPRPSLMFGLDNSPPCILPKLEVQGVVFWSIEKQLLSTLRSKNKGKSRTLPANLNCLHRFSMTIDLQKLGDNSVSVIRGNFDDEIPALPPTGGSVILDMHHLELSTADSLTSNVEVVVRQAIEGRVEGLTQGESSGSAVLSFIALPSAINTGKTDYPTPKASPVPSSKSSPDLSASSSADSKVSQSK